MAAKTSDASKPDALDQVQETSNETPAVQGASESKKTMTIKTNVTLHVPGVGHLPFNISESGLILGGRYNAQPVPPGTPVTLEADEAEAILERFGGEEVTDVVPVK